MATSRLVGRPTYRVVGLHRPCEYVVGRLSVDILTTETVRQLYVTHVYQYIYTYHTAITQLVGSGGVVLVGLPTSYSSTTMVGVLTR